MKANKLLLLATLPLLLGGCGDNDVKNKYIATFKNDRFANLDKTKILEEKHTEMGHDGDIYLFESCVFYRYDNSNMFQTRYEYHYDEFNCLYNVNTGSINYKLVVSNSLYNY